MFLDESRQRYERRVRAFRPPFSCFDGSGRDLLAFLAVVVLGIRASASVRHPASRKPPFVETAKCCSCLSVPAGTASSSGDGDDEDDESAEVSCGCVADDDDDTGAGEARLDERWAEQHCLDLVPLGCVMMEHHRQSVHAYHERVRARVISGFLLGRFTGFWFALGSDGYNRGVNHDQRTCFFLGRVLAYVSVGIPHPIVVSRPRSTMRVWR